MNSARKVLEEIRARWAPPLTHGPERGSLLAPRPSGLGNRIRVLVDGAMAAALAKAITLVESTADHLLRAQQVLKHRQLPKTGKAICNGISGVPGAGVHLHRGTWPVVDFNHGHRLAVLCC